MAKEKNPDAGKYSRRDCPCCKSLDENCGCSFEVQDRYTRIFCKLHKTERVVG